MRRRSLQSEAREAMMGSERKACARATVSGAGARQAREKASKRSGADTSMRSSASNASMG
jgi:hypothetical protein